tara:strand:+ start:564 stop:1766 length:1203 start_codon:yes stop_codon:yes gene_type:complete
MTSAVCSCLVPSTSFVVDAHGRSVATVIPDSSAHEPHPPAMVLLALCCTAGSAGAISLGPSAGTVGRHDLASCSRHLTGRALSTRRLSTPLLCASDEEDRLFGLPREEVAQPLGLLLFSQFVLFVGVGAVIPTIPLYGKSIGLSSAENGLILGAPALALLLGAQPSGRFADVARKPAMIIGMGVIALADLGTCFSASLLPLLLARLGLGAGRCISESGERGMLADLAGRAPELRGRALAGQQATLALGIALGAPLGGLVVEEYGARAAFLCVSAAASLCLALYTLLPETIAGGEATAAPRAAAATGQPAEAEAGPYARWAVLLEDDRWKGLALIEVGSRFGFAAKIASVPILAAAYLSGGATAAGLLVSATGLSGLLGAPLGGLLTDAKGARFVAVRRLP